MEDWGEEIFPEGGGVKHPRWRQQKPDILFSVPLQNNACTAGYFMSCWRRRGLIISALDSGSRGLGSSLRLKGHCAVFLGKTLYSHRASLHPSLYMDTREFNTGGNPAMDLHPIQGRIEIFLVASRYRNVLVPIALISSLSWCQGHTG